MCSIAKINFSPMVETRRGSEKENWQKNEEKNVTTLANL